MCFFWKKSKFWLFFLNNSKNLRLGIKKTNKQTKKQKKQKKQTNKQTFLDLNILHDKSYNLDFLWPLFELFGLKNCQKNPPNWNAKNRWFSKNSDIFLHLMLLLLPMPLFLNLQWEYVLQITDRHLYTMSNTIYIFIF